MRSIIAAFFLVQLFMTPVGFAQTEEPGSPFADPRIVPFMPTDDARIALARRFMNANRFSEAVDILEIIYEKDPDHRVAPSLLRTCYNRLEQYDKAERMVRKLLERDPKSIGHLIYLAEVLVKLDRRPEALVVYDNAAVELTKQDPSRVLTVFRSMLASQLFDETLERIDSLRLLYHDNTLFALERGSVFERRSQYREAALEYLPLLAIDSTADANRAETKLLAMLKFEESAGPVEELLLASVDSTFGLRTMRLMADHYLQTDQYDKSFAFTLREDSLSGRSGLPLIAYLRRCEEQQDWAQVARMARVILDQHPNGGFYNPVAFSYGAALAQTGRTEEAVTVYTELVAKASDDQTRADGLYGLGVIHMEYRSDPDSGLIYFDSVVHNYPRGANYLNARKAIPVCYLRQGKLKDAYQEYRQLLSLNLPEGLAEEFLYSYGLVNFFDGQYDSASVILRKVTVNYPRGYFVNDALRLVLAIDEGKENSDALDEYAAAGLMEYRGLPDSALSRYYRLAESETPVLGDISLYQVIKLQLGRHDNAAAITAAEKLDKEFPESYYRPLGLKLKADLLAEESGSASETNEAKEAKEIYRRLLEEFPDYPFAREVREKLRQLEQQQPVG